MNKHVTLAIVVVGILALVALRFFHAQLGLTAEQVGWLDTALASVGMVATAMGDSILKYLKRDEDGDGVPDVLQDGDK